MRPDGGSGRHRLDAYRDVLAIATYRRLYLGQAVSGLGEGCGFVAVAWLALQLAAPGQRPYAVGLALAAYALPGAVVGLLAASRVAQMDLRRFLVADGVTRLSLLGCVPLLYAVHALPLWSYIALLAGSSVFVSLGRGSGVGIVASSVPEARRFAANSLLTSTQMLSVTLIGPALGGILVASVGGAPTIAVAAASYAAIAWVGIVLPRAEPTAEPADDTAGRRVPLHHMLRRPHIAWLLALTVVFYGLYGPFETALPLFVSSDLRAGPRLYGLLWAAFGAGAIVGGTLTGLREIRRIQTFAVAVVAGWGAAVVLVGATSVPAVAGLGMVLGGLVYSPYPAVTTTLLQRVLPARELAAGAAGWFAMVTLVPEVTIAAGGPIVGAIGARVTVLGSGVATVVLALLVAVGGRRSVRDDPP